MTDRHRFGRRASELRVLVSRMEPLAKMPDRVTATDIQRVVDVAKKAADDLDELSSAQPPGCVCRWYENDNYRWLDYTEACVHHGQLHAMREKLKADYAKMEKALKDETRVKLVAAALSGSAVLPAEGSPDDEDLVKRAIAIADEAICQITRDA